MSETTNSEPVGKIIVLSGSATAQSSEGQRPLEIGSPVYQEDIIKTDPGSKLQVKFIDNTQVSQAENSTLKIDSVVYNPDAADNSNLLLDLMKGTFRTISGEITKDSPSHFMLKSPQGTIGIRGTIVVSQVTDLFEKHGVEKLTPGKIVVIEDNFGNIRIFNVPMEMVEFYSGKPVSEVRELLLDELDDLQGQAPLTQDDGDTPLGYTAPEGSFQGSNSDVGIVPSGFGMVGNMVVRFNSGADLFAVFDSLNDVPGYTDNGGSNQDGVDQGPNDNTGFITDDDSGTSTFTVEAADAVQEESDSEGTTFTFLITRTGDIDAVESVNWAVEGAGLNPADADDFGGTLPSGTVVFGEGETVRTITVTVSGDNINEADESFTVVLLDPATNEVIQTDVTQAIIVNDDTIEIISLADLDGSNGFRIDGIDAGDESGSAVSHAVDINGDGFGDFVITAPGAEGDNGAAYVVFGQESPGNMNLEDLGRADGFRMDGTDVEDMGDRLIAHAGDINGDGFDDFLFGVPEANDAAGQTYVIFGGQEGVSDTMDLSDLNGIFGIRLDGVDAGDLSGTSVSSGGDINGDGFDDIIIGAPGAADAAGQTYVIFGGDYSGVVTHQGTEADETLTGTLSNDIMIGDLGDDTLDGMGGADVLYGGAGNDSISVDANAFLRVNGGGNLPISEGGMDTLSFEHTAVGDDNVVNVDLTEVANDMIRGIEKIDLIEGQSDTSLTLSLNDILDMSDTTDTLIIDGGLGDSLTVTDGWWSPPIEEVNPPIGSDDASYVTYFGDNGAVLQVDADIQVNIVNSMVF